MSRFYRSPTVAARRFTRQLRGAAARRRAKALSIGIAIASPAMAFADNWINPNGGIWSTASNWSDGAEPPYQYDYYSQFSLGALTPYTVTNPYYLGSWICVQNDQVSINFNGITTNPYNSFGGEAGDLISVTSAAGQTSSLTLVNGAIMGDSPTVLGGTGGVSTLTLNNFTLENGLEGSTGLSFAGAPNTVVNFNQIGGSVTSFYCPITIGGGGAANISLTNGTIQTNFYEISFGGAIPANIYINNEKIAATSEAPIGFSGNTTLNSSQVGFGTDIVFAGTASASSSNLSGAGLYVGSQSSIFYGNGEPVGVLNMFNCTGSLAEVLIGDQGIGTLTVSGSNSSIGLRAASYPTLLYIGVQGTGSVRISAAAQLYSGATFIGFNGGTGSLSISGATWTGGAGDANIGNGIVELDTKAIWSNVQANVSGTGLTGGTINLSGGTLEILSGSRVYATVLNMSSGSTLEIGLDSPSVTTNGQIQIGSLADLGGTLDVVFENGFTPMAGEQFQLLTFGSKTGTFSSLELPPGVTADTSQLYTNGTITITAVPEPAGFAALAACGATLTLRRRRLPVAASVIIAV